MSQHTIVQGPTKVPIRIYDYTSKPEAYPVDEFGGPTKWGDLKFVFGWDQALMSFYLQVHDAFVVDPDANPVIWLGADQKSQMYEVEHLVQVAMEHGLGLTREMQMTLYSDKDDGR